MFGNLLFPNPASAGAHKVGFLLASAAVVFVLGMLFNAHRMGKFRKKQSGGSPESLRRKVRWAVFWTLVAVLAVLALKFLLGSG